MKAIKIFCCSCNNLKEVIHVDGEGVNEVLGDICDSCYNEQKKPKVFKKAPKLGVIVNDSKQFEMMMSERKVNNKLSQPKKKGAKR